MAAAGAAMWPAIAAGASALASGVGGILGYRGQKEANAANLEIAAKQMRFQERMSNTAYQRAARDLEKAGLNRVLALGSPASSPGGASATMANVHSGTPEAARGVGNSARQFAEMQLLKSQTQLTDQNARKAQFEADQAELTKGWMSKVQPTVDDILDKVPGLINSVKDAATGGNITKVIEDKVNAGKATAKELYDDAEVAANRAWLDAKQTAHRAKVEAIDAARRGVDSYKEMWKGIGTGAKDFVKKSVKHKNPRRF